MSAHDPTEASRAVARRFIEGLGRGRLPDDLFAPDAAIWTTSSGAGAVAAYLGGVPLLASLFAEPAVYTLDRLTAEGDRVAVEAHAAGVLTDGQAYANRYVFMIEVRDGRIVSLSEHFDPRPVQALIVPLLMRAMAARGG